MNGDVPRQMNGLPDGRLFLIPTSDIECSPSWQEAAAMGGTDSNAVSVRDVFVPESFAHTPVSLSLLTGHSIVCHYHSYLHRPVSQLRLELWTPPW